MSPGMSMAPSKYASYSVAIGMRALAYFFASFLSLKTT